MQLQEHVFLDLSLLAYFPYPNIGCSVSQMISYIQSDDTIFEREEYRRNKQMVEEMQDDCYDDIYLYRVMNDNEKTGVVCYVFLYNDQFIFSFRGSEELIKDETYWQDWIDNFAMFLNKPTYQQLYALQIVYEVSPKHDFYVCGHSKGGNLAQFCAIAMKDAYVKQLQGVYSFNACGMQKGICDAYTYRLKDKSFIEKVYIYENEYDCVSSIFTRICPAIILASITPCQTLQDYYYHHYLYMVEKEDGKLKRANKKDRLPILLEYMVQLFIKYHNQEWFEKFVEKTQDYFHSNLSLDDLCQIIQYQVECTFPKAENISMEEILHMKMQDVVKLDTIKKFIKMIYVKQRM